MYYNITHNSYILPMCAAAYLYRQDWITNLYPGVVNDYTANMCMAQYNIFFAIGNVFTNFLPCSHAINPNNETRLVTCAVSLTCATWLFHAQFFL